MFSDIQKQLKEAQERWEKIDKLVDQLDHQIKTSTEESVVTTAKLVMLLVEQLKPMSAMDSDEFGQGVKQMLDAFTGGKK